MRENSGFLEQFKGRGNEWEGVPILNGNAVKIMVVNTGSQCPVLLADEEKPGPRGGERGMDETRSPWIIYIGVHGLQLRFRQRVQGVLGGCGARQKVNSAMIWAVKGRDLALALLKTWQKS